MQTLGLNQLAFVEALKSGKYTQIKRHLHTDEGFCATGLMAHITGCEWHLFCADGLDYCYSLMEEDGLRTNILPETYNKLYAVRESARIYALNDEGQSFEQIAAAIEADPAEFFTEAR